MRAGANLRDEPAWRAEACQRLWQTRRDGAAWGYRPKTEPAAEPTALATLALRCAGEPEPRLRSAGDFLEALQGPDGSVGVSLDQPSPTWGTMYAVMAWSALSGFQHCRDRAIAYLLATGGVRIPREPNSPYGHDSMLQGWPWVAGTHSWLEPTAAAVMALRRAGRGGHERVHEAQRLILDRAIGGGGWNYGNSAVFQTPLRPQPASTGMALVALAGLRVHPDPDPNAAAPPADGPPRLTEGIRTRAVAYLQDALPKTRAACSLGWGVLGLSAWNSRPPETETWLIRAVADLLKDPRRPDPWRESHLLLAGYPNRALELLGCDPVRQDQGGAS